MNPTYGFSLRLNTSCSITLLPLYVRFVGKYSFNLPLLMNIFKGEQGKKVQDEADTAIV
jgi:hypothetical protein